MPTADALRDQSPESTTSDQAEVSPKRAGLDTVLNSDLAKLAMEFSRQREPLLKRRQAISEASTDLLAEKSRELAPLRAEVLRSGQDLAEAAKNAPTPPDLSPPPSFERRPFLVGPEKPQDVLGGFLKAFSLLAAPVAGLIAKDGLTAINDMNGAMQGWMRGDDDRVQREMETWKLATETALKKFDMAHGHYQDILTSGKLTLDQKLTSVQIVANQYDDGFGQFLAQQRSLDDMLKELDNREKLAQNVRISMGKIEMGLAMAEATRGYREKVLQGQEAGRKETARYHDQMAETAKERNRIAEKKADESADGKTTGTQSSKVFISERGSRPRQP